MQVAKFGGTSLANTENILQVLNIVEAKLKKLPENCKLTIVLSAIGGVTASLHELYFHNNKEFLDSKTRRERREKKLTPLIERHLDIAKALLSRESYICYHEIVNEIFANIATILETITLQNDLSASLQELLLPQGELLSSKLFFLCLKERSIDSTWLDSREFIISKKHNNRTNIDLKACRAHCTAVKNQLRRVNVFPGFIAATPDGCTTTLGRNGSDYSASILTYGLEAEMMEIWTDVDGILTTDPRIVSDAAIIPEMSIEEAMEMAYFGARVIHAQMLLPIILHPCPVRICNTFNPEEPGTMIRNDKKILNPKRLLTSISYVEDASLFLLDGMFLSSVKFLSRVFRAFEKAQVEPIMVIRVTADNKLCLIIYKKDLSQAIEAISSEFFHELENKEFASPKIDNNISIISVIGEQMRGKIGTVGGIFSDLAELNINILAIGQDITENNISFIVQHKDQEKNDTLSAPKIFIEYLTLFDLW